MKPPITLEQLLQQRQAEQAQQAIYAQQSLQLAQIQQRNHINSLGAIMAWNMQQNAIQQFTAVQSEPQPNAEPPRVTVEDIFEYHAEKDRTAIPYRSIVD